MIDFTKNGYRAATPEERERFHERGNCCVIRVYPDGSAKMAERLCPHPRIPNQCLCTYHTGLISGPSEREKGNPTMSSNPTPSTASTTETKKTNGNGNGHAKSATTATKKKPAKETKAKTVAAPKAAVAKKNAKTKTATTRKPAARDKRTYSDEEIKAAKARFVKKWESLPPSAKSWKDGDGWVGSPGYLDAVSKRRAHRASR